MQCVRKITDDIFMIGANDRRIALFENVYPVPTGISYNSYLINDEKTVLLDTVDKAVRGVFIENLKYALGSKKLDYIVVNHMEPDHCAVIADVYEIYPDVKIVCNAKTLAMIKQFFDFENVDIDSSTMLVKEGDILETGRHKLTFVMAPMVHWPEVMVTYDLTENVLFSADAFGSFGALNGNVFARKEDYTEIGMSEARRYYTNIVGKYGAQVQALLKKASKLPISMVCPLHGPVWKENIELFIDKYAKWSTYTPEEKGALILYGSIYGGTENAAEILAAKLSESGVENIAIYDVSKTDPSYIVAEAFKYSHIVFASATYNAGIFTPMENVLNELQAHNLQNRTVAIMENGSWAPMAGNLIKKKLEAFKNITLIENVVTIKSAVKTETLEAISVLAAELAYTINADISNLCTENIDNNAFFKLGYGLYVLSAKDTEGKDNGCIINTVMQVTDTPKRILIAVNKSNYTNKIIKEMGVFNVSTLTEKTPFDLFKRFGFQSGKDVNKFEDFTEFDRASNGISYINKNANSYISCKVISSMDYGTHTVFVADVSEAVTMNDEPSVTYDYYFKNIKPSPAKAKKKGYVCKICGYVYEGDELPADFICPLCKHGAADFEPLE